MTGRDCPAARYVVGGGQPGPATHLQFVQAAVKMENAPDLEDFEFTDGEDEETENEDDTYTEDE